MTGERAKPTEPQPGHGAVFIPDPRDAGFLAGAAVAGHPDRVPADVFTRDVRELPAVVRYPAFAGAMNQGSTSMCVAFARKAVTVMAPARHGYLRAPGIGWVYWYAQGEDLWPGREPVYFGTSPRAGWEAYRYLGLVEAYYHLRTVGEVQRWVSLVGPISLAVNWRRSMDAPDPRTHVVPVDWGAVAVGGHDVAVSGVDNGRGLLTFKQSWGPGYGRDGDAELGFGDLERFLAEGAEAIAPVLTPPGLVDWGAVTARMLAYGYPPREGYP